MYYVVFVHQIRVGNVTINLDSTHTVLLRLFLLIPIITIVIVGKYSLLQLHSHGFL